MSSKTLLIFTLLVALSAPLLAQDFLWQARKLYESAEYEDALKALESADSMRPLRQQQVSRVPRPLLHGPGQDVRRREDY